MLLISPERVNTISNSPGDTNSPSCTKVPTNITLSCSAKTIQKSSRSSPAKHDCRDFDTIMYKPQATMISIKNQLPIYELTNESSLQGGISAKRVKQGVKSQRTETQFRYGSK